MSHVLRFYAMLVIVLCCVDL